MPTQVGAYSDLGAKDYGTFRGFGGTGRAYMSYSYRNLTSTTYSRKEHGL